MIVFNKVHLQGSFYNLEKNPVNIKSLSKLHIAARNTDYPAPFVTSLLRTKLRCLWISNLFLFFTLK